MSELRLAQEQRIDKAIALKRVGHIVSIRTYKDEPAEVWKSVIATACGPTPAMHEALGSYETKAEAESVTEAAREYLAKRLDELAAGSSAEGGRVPGREGREPASLEMRR